MSQLALFRDKEKLLARAQLDWIEALREYDEAAIDLAIEEVLAIADGNCETIRCRTLFVMLVKILAERLTEEEANDKLFELLDARPNCVAEARDDLV